MYRESTTVYHVRKSRILFRISVQIIRSKCNRQTWLCIEINKHKHREIRWICFAHNLSPIRPRFELSSWQIGHKGWTHTRCRFTTILHCCKHWYTSNLIYCVVISPNSENDMVQYDSNVYSLGMRNQHWESKSQRECIIPGGGNMTSHLWPSPIWATSVAKQIDEYWSMIWAQFWWQNTMKMRALYLR